MSIRNTRATHFTSAILTFYTLRLAPSNRALAKGQHGLVWSGLVNQPRLGEIVRDAWQISIRRYSDRRSTRAPSHFDRNSDDESNLIIIMDVWMDAHVV